MSLATKERATPMDAPVRELTYAQAIHEAMSGAVADVGVAPNA